MARTATLTLGLAVLALWTSPAAAQERSGLSFVVGAGYEHGGPGPTLVDALDVAGLNHDMPKACLAPGVCKDAREYPFHWSEGLNVSVWFGARYRFGAPFSLEGLIANGQRGHAEGRNLKQRDHLVITYSTVVGHATAGVHLGPLRVGLGPALNAGSWKAIYDSSRIRRTRSLTPGVVGMLSYERSLRRMVLSLRASHQRFPNAAVENPMQVPVEARYRSTTIGLTISPWVD